MTTEMTSEQDKLQRKVNLPLLSFYGIGTILGAGIYVLIGKVAGNAGMQTPLAFLVAAVLAGLTAFSYAELSVRFPKSAGEAIYIQEGFRLKPLSIFVGLLIVAIGMTSTATLLNGLIGYVNELFDVSRWVVISVCVFFMTAVVAWGIGQSVLIASIMTVLEILGLLIIIWVGADSFTLLPEKAAEIFLFNDTSDIADAMIWSGILLGAFVAFYAFIGFEDMVNIAEEVKDPKRTLPRGIIIALVVTTLFYIIIALVSVLSVIPAELAKSDAPLAMIYRIKTGGDANFIILISIVSILNGALVQLVMASRILYGMSRRKWLPEYFSRVNKHTHTPILATLTVGISVLVLALALPLLSLAKLTSLITLIIFTLINIALIRIKLRNGVSDDFHVWLWVPVVGAISCGLFLIYQIYNYFTSSNFWSYLFNYFLD